MDNRNFLIAFLFLLMPGIGFAQSDSYNLDIYPDAWYNSVDGVRIGGFVLGEMEGEFKSGPHRLDAGVWLGTNFPDLPVSYYLSFTEPIPPFTSPANEANFRIISSIRTGLSRHGISFNKRWQPGFDDLDFQELSFSYTRERMFDFDYRPYPQLWDDEWKNLFWVELWVSRNFEPGRFNLQGSFTHNLDSYSFNKADLEITQQVQLPKGFEISLRGFTGYVSGSRTPEYLYGRSYRPAAEWLDNGISRAKGTVPTGLLDEGLVHFNGGANLRGYTNQDFQQLSSGNYPLNYQFVGSLNAEVDFPNPINSFFNNTIAKGVIHFRSYLFGDTGIFHRDNYIVPGGDVVVDIIDSYSDAGIGIQFSVNIPDYLGKDRGFALRYEIPFWLSDPANGENKFKFRNLIGIGAVISL